MNPRVALVMCAVNGQGPSVAGIGALGRALLSLDTHVTAIARRQNADATPAGDELRIKTVYAVADGLMRKRGFAGGVTCIPGAVAALSKDRELGVAHAFSVVDAQAALIWRRLTGRPVVFTCLEPPSRESIASRRLLLDMTARSFRFADAVTAVSDDVASAVQRWLSLEVPVVELPDAPAYREIYVRCTSGGVTGESAERFW